MKRQPQTTAEQVLSLCHAGTRESRRVFGTVSSSFRLLKVPGALGLLLLLLRPMYAEDLSQKIQGRLRLIDEHITLDGQDGEGGPPSIPSRQIRLDAQRNVQVYIHLTNVSAAIEGRLRNLGCRAETSNADLKIVQGWLSRENLNRVCALDEVTTVRCPDYGTLNAGSVTTEGDGILNADQVRALGIDGTGVKVGIISDGVTSRQAAIDSGDLPSTIEIVPGMAGVGDEGTAMLEIVHDLAPGASLAFAGIGVAVDQLGTSLDFINAISGLRALGCNVICDDIGFFDSPYFEDGPIAQAAQAAVDAGAFYCSAAGNHAQVHYEADYSDMGQLNRASRTFNNVHDFGGSDSLATISLADLSLLVMFLQWSDPFDSAVDDFEIYILSSDGSQVLAGSDSQPQVAGQAMKSVAHLQMQAADVDIVIEHTSGTGTPRLEVFLLGFGHSNFEHVVPGGSIFGHAAAAGVFAVGAISASDPGNDDVETFSNQGPSELYFPARVTRNKPEACGIDGATITGAGGFSNPFYGTSAAAPHVAGVAALLLQARPSGTPAEITAALQNTAVDIGAAGYDPIAGSGRIDALAAILSLPATPVSVTLDPTDVLGPLTATGTVTLLSAATEVTVVTLQSSDPSVAAVPGSVVINPPGRTATFQVTTQAVTAPRTVNITATANQGSASGTLTVSPPSPQSITFDLPEVEGGGTATATVTLRNAASPGETLIVSLLSSNPSVASVPMTVTVPLTTANMSFTFTVSGHPVARATPVNITATLNSIGSTGALIVDVGGGEATGGGGGCFVASAAYGSKLDSRIVALSRFRDDCLLPSPVGRAFTRTYYGNSPVPARFLGRSAALRLIARQTIAPAVGAAESRR